MMDLTHVNTATGDITMVNIGQKKIVRRTALASGKVCMKPATIDLIRKGLTKKGDVLVCAKIAGITAAKQTGTLIPLGHQIPLDVIEIEFKVNDDNIEISSMVQCRWATGVEMEALTAVSVAALTIYDMCKAADTSMSITDILLVKKTKENIQ
jgi:cyclic pyranopterin monophosphate synthase